MLKIAAKGDDKVLLCGAVRMDGFGGWRNLVSISKTSDKIYEILFSNSNFH